jgi:hypothetical protein
MTPARFVASALCFTALGLAACGGDQPQQQSPIPPNLVTNTTNNCAPNVFPSLISGYFAQPQQAIASGYKDAMLNALPNDAPTARTNGFNLMREIAIAAKAGAANFSAGSDLTRETLKCIFNVNDTNVVKGFATLSFVDPLKHAAGGGYDVRAGLDDDEAPVFGLNPTNTAEYLSGVSVPPPPPLAAAYTWTGISSERVLIYGFPVGTNIAYDWSAIPRRATFNPGAIVGLCVADGTESMIQQAGQFILAFQEASYFLDPDLNGACTASLASIVQPTGLFAFGHRLREWGQSAFGVTPLQASMVSPGLTGGNAGSLRSLFDDETITGSVTLEYVTQPSDAFVNQAISPPVTVKASSTDGPVAGVKVTLLLVNNNGKKVVPAGNVAITQIELSNGQPVAIARFTNLGTNKSGAYIAEIQSDPAASGVLGRPAIELSIPTPLSRKFNIRPK